jgi:tryptophan-rich sensory protein
MAPGEMLELPPDPAGRRPLKLLLIASLAIGALASLARPQPVPGLAFWLVQPAWTLIYILMAVAAWLAWAKGGWKSWALTLFAGQLVLNLFWRTWPSPALGLGLDLVMGLTLIAFMHRNVLAALAFLPCLAWVLFLTLPNLGHWHLG